MVILFRFNFAHYRHLLINYFLKCKTLFTCFLPGSRFHKFSFCSNEFDNGSTKRSYKDENLNGISSLSIIDRSKMQAKLDVDKTEDVFQMREELGKARENLTEVKAIQLYISQQRPAIPSKLLCRVIYDDSEGSFC